ncbi:amidohydrolase family protein [Falsiroseomonas selenitidurans]|uniref:Amidohydrolase family protein n=1 Tax=Falsiroseomonas selenitidurans TaxID=2716335 RepID=A0ABX1E2R7_9PROT|nr:amidohydrolase family protein [Falsiroseomonas selenitidurans]NKC31460.1 amidohydrolase family protein [Falsiroseomonas selenitidurans]
MMLLIQGALVLAEAAAPPQRADILVREGRILAVAPGLDDPAHPARAGLPPPDRVIDARRRLAMPGLVNAHYHSHDVLLKGMFEPLPLEQWNLLALPPGYPRRPREELRLRTLLGAAECLRSGITTVQDMNRLHPFDEDDLDLVLDCYRQVGLRVVFAPHFSEVPPTETIPFLADCVPEAERWRLSGGLPLVPRGTDALDRIAAAIAARQTPDGLVSFALGPSAPERVRPATLRRIADVSARLGIPVFTHLYESRATVVHARHAAPEGSLVAQLRQAGLLGPQLALAHCVWLSQAEIEAVAQSGTHVVLNPVGNLKTRSGIAPVKALRRAGAALALGADNCSCSDSQNLFQVMKAFCTLPAVSDDPDEDPPAAADALQAATEGGARALGLGGQVGAIRPGMRADIVLLDLTDPCLVPLNSAVRQVVFAESGRAVRTVLVEGRVVVEEGRLVAFDEATLAEEAAALMPALRADADAVRARLAPIFPMVQQANSRAWAEKVPLWRYAGTCPVCAPGRLRAEPA